MDAWAKTVTISAADIYDVENWELSTVIVEDNGETVNFLPHVVRNKYGDIVVELGRNFPSVKFVLKRSEVDAMEVTVEMEIQRLTERTLVAATAPNTRAEDEIQANIDEWKALGKKAHDTDPVKYANALRDSLDGF